MNNKPSITYIKNGREKTIKHFLIHNFEKEIGEIEDEYFHYTYCINKDIEYVHFKNFKFTSIDDLKNIKLIYKNPNTIIILENCYIIGTNKFLINSYFTASVKNDAHVQIINPISTKDIEIEICCTKNIDINLIDQNNFVYLDIQYCKNINLICTNQLNELRIYGANNVYIKSLNDKITRSTLYDIENLILENSIIIKSNISQENLHLKNSTIENKEKILCKGSKLILENNSKIISGESISIPFLKELIFIDNDKTILDTSSYLQGEFKIKLGEKSFKRTNPSIPLVITKKDLETNLNIKRQELLFVLKNLNRILLNDISKELSEKTNELKEEITKIEQNQQEELKKLLEEKQKQNKQIIFDKQEEGSKEIKKHQTYLLTKKIKNFKNEGE